MLWKHERRHLKMRLASFVKWRFHYEPRTGVIIVSNKEVHLDACLSGESLYQIGIAPAKMKAMGGVDLAVRVMVRVRTGVRLRMMIRTRTRARIQIRNIQGYHQCEVGPWR